jgi:hypothetical protein
MDDNAWHVYAMPADPRMGSVWCGSYADRPGVEIDGSAVIIDSDEDSETITIISLVNVCDVLIARKHHLEDDPRDAMNKEAIDQMARSIEGGDES